MSSYDSSYGVYLEYADDQPPREWIYQGLFIPASSMGSKTTSPMYAYRQRTITHARRTWSIVRNTEYAYKDTDSDSAAIELAIGQFEGISSYIASVLADP